MSNVTTVERPATAPQRAPYVTHSVTSEDGTAIGYRQLGRGPGLVVLHGAMESAQSHMQLAEALADTFTVYLPDRRGRGLSGPSRADDSLATHVADMDAVLSETGAHHVFGVSSGAIIWLQAALTLPAIHKAAIFEPPLVVDGSAPTDFVARYDEEIAQGRVAAALVTGMKGAHMGPAIFNVIPRSVLTRLTTMMMAAEDKRAMADDVTMRMLAPTLHGDFQLVVETDGVLDRFKAIQADVLLLGGSKSPAYLKAALDALEKALPDARRIEFAGLNHGGSGNRNRGGKPLVVAKALRDFFLA
jgi:pimeloyl-ACP methyl ester carboxylesterase